MIIGKWNKTVILTYIGVIISIIGMYFALNCKFNYAYSCLIISGICDLFDGKVARMFKRTKEEEQFGIQIDSLADMVSFILFPIIIYMSMGITSWYAIIVYAIFALCGIARLAYFNIDVKEEKQDQPIKFYRGLPVTYVALIMPLFELIVRWLNLNFLYLIEMFIISILFILNIKVIKPKGIAYAIFGVLAIIMVGLYITIL